MSALLALSHVSVRLRGRCVVDDISVQVAPGEIVALLGANGAGKTSLIRASLGMLAAAGAVSLGGAEPGALTARARALRGAYLPQRPQAIWPVAVEHVVALGRYAHGGAPERLSAVDQDAVDRAIAMCALGPLRTRRMDEISGGEKARAHLARALAQGAPLLALDEPTAGLDPAQALAVADILTAHASKGGGVLLSTHDIGLAARLGQKLLLLREGRALGQGAPEHVLTREALAQAYGRDVALAHTEVGSAFVFR